jgi:putative aminopeptidase FrvX
MHEFPSTKTIIDRLDSYLKIPSVVGFEKLFLTNLEQEAKTFGFLTKKTSFSLLISRTPNPSKQIITAHVDRHGFIINNSGQVEFCAFYQKHLHQDTFHQTKTVFQQTSLRYLGEEIYAYNPQTGEEISSGIITHSEYNFEKKRVYFTTKNLDTGLPSNTPVALRSKLSFQNNYFSSQIDNAISVAVAMQLLIDGFNGSVLFVAQEEIGRSWQYILMSIDKEELSSDIFITLDTSPFKKSVSLDTGAIVLREKDQYAEFNLKLNRLIEKICIQESIPFRYKDKYIQKSNIRTKAFNLSPRTLGRTELGAVIAHTQGKCTGTTIQLPTMNYHTNKETSSILALSNWYKILRSLLL